MKGKKDDVKKLILEVIENKGRVNSLEIRELAIQKHIITKDDKNTIHNALFSLKNNKLIVPLGKGEYIKVKDQNTPVLYRVNNLEEKLEYALSVIDEKLDYYESFNWFDLDDVALLEEKQKVKKLVQLASRINKKFISM